MSKNSERVKLWTSEYWFGSMMWILQDVRESIEGEIKRCEAARNAKGADGWREYLRANLRLVDKIIKYGWYEEKPEGRDEARVEFFASEARDMIWQLLLYSTIHSPEGAGTGLYEEYKKKHEAYKSGELTIPNELSDAAAAELIEASALGRTYLVKNKDGRCYLVDHGYTELIKTADGWEDKEYGFEEEVFEETEHSYEIVSWEDEEPLDIDAYLKEHGWI